MEVKQERWVMVGHVISVTETHLGVIAATGTSGGEVGGDVMCLEDGVTCRHTGDMCMF